MRLLVSTALFGTVIVFEPGLTLTHLNFGGIVVPLSALAFPFTILCLVGLQNALNMADGMNGLLIGCQSSGRPACSTMRRRKFSLT